MKFLNCLLLTLVGLLLLLPDKSHGDAGGDLNLTNKASLSSRSGYNLTLGTESASDEIDFVVAGSRIGQVTSSGLSGFALVSPTFTTLTGTAALSLVSTDTADAADNKVLSLTGAGAIGGSRGAYLSLTGNESSGTGQAVLAAGNAAGATLDLYTLGSNAINLYTNSLKRWDIGTSGNLSSDATNGGDIVFNKSSQVRAGTADGADNLIIYVSSGGTGASSRGGWLQMAGNEAASGGYAIISGGNVSTGHVNLDITNASALIRTRNSSGGVMWQTNNSGEYRQDATNGGSIILGKVNTNVKSSAASIAAAGANQATATQLARSYHYVSSGSGGVKLENTWDATNSATAETKIHNVTGGAINVYPPSGGTIIGSGGADTAVSVANSTMTTCYQVSNTLYACSEAPAA